MFWPLAFLFGKRSRKVVRRTRPKHVRPAVESLESRSLLASLPSGFVETPVAVGLSNATAMEIAPNGDLWILEQGGAVKRFRPGSTSADIVGNLSNLGLSSAGERGVLGIAFDPQYQANKQVYLYYTAVSPTVHNRMSRFTVNDTDATDYYFAGASTSVPDAGASGTPTQSIIFDLDNLSGATNHNGGAIHFGPDGKLYVAVGENANGANSQVLTNVLGKILRMNSDGTAPSDNPFLASTTGKQQTIWALGLRNPFTFAFQPGTGRLFINDVGQNTWEEIDDGIAGSNYGWPATEGNTGTPPGGPGTYRGPLHTYSHGGGTFQGFSIAGGAFYNQAVQQFPAQYTGDYFFADYVNDWINVLDLPTGTVTRFASNAFGTVDLRIASDGSLYYLARDSGAAFQVRFGDNQAPIAINDTYNTNEDSELVVQAPSGVLGNDTDADGDTISAVIVAEPSHGTVALNANGGFTYIPAADYNGPDAFTYRASDGQHLSNIATVSLTVAPINDPPAISVLSDRTIDQDSSLTVGFTIVDIETPPANLTVSASADNATLLPPGSLVVGGSGASRILEITPSAHQNGTATVRVTVEDGELTAAREFILTVSSSPHPWHNAQNALDVDDNDVIAPADALVVINRINADGATALPPPSAGDSPPPFVDVSADNFLAPNDALIVINYLNAQAPAGEGESKPAVADVEARLIADLVTQLPRRRLRTAG